MKGGDCIDLSKTQFQQLRETEIEILKQFIHVCEELNLSYFLVQGTLLGAVRHAGFIPWDDDIDVGMKREDYDIFLKKGQQYLKDGYFIQNVSTDPEYPHGFSKIRKTKTTFLEKSCKNLDINHGIYIDVFPFDYYPDSKLQGLILETKKVLLRYRIRCSLHIPQDKKITPQNLIRNAIKAFSCMVYPSIQEARRKQDELYSGFHEGKQRVNMGSPWGKRERIPADWIEETTLLAFENMKLRAPVNYKEYLSHVYGNYMEMPPPEERIPHHYIDEIDFEHSYTKRRTE